MINEIKTFRENNDWEGIIKLLNAENDIPYSLDSNMLINLAYAYSSYARNLNDTNNKDLSEKILLLAEKAYAYIIQRNDSYRLMALKGLAYVCYNSFINRYLNGTKKLLNERDQETLKYKTRYKNLAVYLYHKLTEETPQDVKQFYRYGKLLKEAINIYRHETKYIVNTENSSIRMIYSKYLDEFYSKDSSHLCGLFSPKEIEEYTENLPNTNNYFLLKKRAVSYLESAVAIYDSLQEQDLKDRYRKEYLKAMHNYCKVGLNTGWFNKPDNNGRYLVPPNTINEFINRIIQEENLDMSYNIDMNRLKRDALSNPKKRGVDIKFTYHLIAQFAFTFKADNIYGEPSSERLNALKESIYREKEACMVEIFQSNERRSKNRYSFNRASFDEFFIQSGFYIRTYMKNDPKKELFKKILIENAQEIIKRFNQKYKNKIPESFKEEKANAILNGVNILEKEIK